MRIVCDIKKSLLENNGDKAAATSAVVRHFSPLVAVVVVVAPAAVMVGVVIPAGRNVEHIVGNSCDGTSPP